MRYHETCRTRGRFHRAVRTWAIGLGLASAGLIVSTPPADAQQQSVGGVVVSAQTQQPLAGAQISVVGTNRGTIAGPDGRFLVPGITDPEVTLQVTMIGYRSETRAVPVGQLDVRFELRESAVELDQIVVTGTAGAQQKRAIGNSVTQVRAAEAVEIAPITSIQSLINARAPGVVITPGTGMIGSGSQIRIRGTNSFSLSAQPLLYVDGVRADNAQATGISVQAFGSSVISRINDFNPDDIESIEIIKGPAAATLYGTEASNGVIQIITKRGGQGRPVWNLTVRQGANWFADAADRVPTNYWRNPDTGQVESINFYETEKARGTPIFRTGHLQNYSLSLSGGSADVRYYIAGDYDRDQGAQLDNELRRGSVRANLSVVPSDNLDLNASVGYTGGRTDLSCEAGCGGVTWAAYFSDPEHAQGDDPRRGARSFPPEYYNQVLEFFQDLARFTGSLQSTHRPTSWFDHRLTVGVDVVSEDNQDITEKSALYRQWSPTGTGGKFVGRRDVSNQTLDYNGTLRFDVSPALASNTSFGAQYYRRYAEFVSAGGSDFATPGLRIINAAAETSAGESYTENVTVGVFGQQQFGWNDRLFVTAAIRADDNSAFGEEFDLVYYPKVSATWVISEEPFWNLEPVSALRLRTAYGQTGQQPGAFDALRTFDPVPGPDDVSTVTPLSVGNPDLGPERGDELEIGFDAGFLDDRVGLDFTWYNQRTRDAILLQPVAPSTGFPGSRFINLGEVKNIGFEALVRATPVITPNLEWDATFSIARNENEVVNIGPDVDRIVVSSSFGVEHRVGFPLGAWFHQRVVSAEFDASGQRIRETMMCDDGQGGTTPCFNGSELVAPLVHLGQSEPKLEGAFSSTLMLANRIRLYGLLDFKTGFKKWDHVTRVRCSLFNVCEENVDPLKFVDTAPARLASYQEGARFGAEYIVDSGFVRFREVSASYILPDNLAQRMGATRASINVAGRNLYTWSDWTGMDPEARFLSGARGGFGPLEQNHLPQLTSFITTINLTF
ncbi:MAG: SusC/RagA family TonB-linked outer membrane protein [Longimicrobiales bacterium]